MTVGRFAFLASAILVAGTLLLVFLMVRAMVRWCRVWLAPAWVYGYRWTREPMDVPITETQPAYVGMTNDLEIRHAQHALGLGRLESGERLADAVARLERSPSRCCPAVWMPYSTGVMEPIRLCRTRLGAARLERRLIERLAPLGCKEYNEQNIAEGRVPRDIYRDLERKRRIRREGNRGLRSPRADRGGRPAPSGGARSGWHGR